MKGFGEKKLTLAAPMKGRILDITEVSDPVFAEKMMGDGFAIDPEKGVDTLLSPCDAEVALVAKTRHAVALRSSGAEILLHVGIDTVSLEGKGFRVLVKEGDAVKRGAPLLLFDREEIAAAGKSLVTMVVVTGADAVKKASKKLDSSDEVMTLVLK